MASWPFTENLYNLPMPESKPLVAIIMGSKSDWDTMRNAVETLDELGVPNEARVLSAHRTPDATAEFARGAADRGLRVIIAGAGGAAHLAGVIAAHHGCRSRCANSIETPGTRFAVVHGANARWHSGRNAGYRSGRRKKMPRFWRLRFSPDLKRRSVKRQKCFAGNSPKRSCPRNCQGENSDFNRPRRGG